MAAQTITTPVNHDSDSVLGLLNGETYTINGGSLTVDCDVRWGQNNAVLGNISISATLGGSVLLDGRNVWEISFASSTGNVPTLLSLGSNTVTGNTSGATGELFRVWDSTSLVPLASGGAMPSTGWVKLRSKTGNFLSGETITLPGGATIVAASAGKRSWIQAVGARTATLTVPRLGSFTVEGDWYELGETNGLPDQRINLPFIENIPAVQIETSPGSGEYEWWLNAGRRWPGANPVVASFVSTDSRGKYFGQDFMVTGASTTSGSNIIGVPSTADMVVGMPIVFSAGFADADNLYISQIDSPTQLRVSTNSNATGTGRTIETFRASIEIAHRSLVESGLLPPAGCKIRIPNVIIGTTTAGPNDGNTWRGQISEGVGGDRWDLTTTAAGAISVKKVTDAAFLGTTNAYSILIEDSCTFSVSHANTATAPVIRNVAVGLCRAQGITGLSFSNQFTGVELSRCRVSRYSSGNNTSCASITDCVNVSGEDNSFEVFGGSLSGTLRDNVNTFAILSSRCFDISLKRTNVIGGKLTLRQNSRVSIEDVRYADLINGDTTATNGIPAIDIADTSSDIVIDGFRSFDNIPNVHPYNQILLVAFSSSDVELRNVGTPSAPYVCGPTNATANILSASVSLNITLRRVYTLGLRTSALVLTNTVQNVNLLNVWDLSYRTQAIPALNVTPQGCAWSQSLTGQSSVYGRHWEDSFYSENAGRFLIACNEPLPATAGQVSFNFVPGSGFTSAGQVSMASTSDSVTWEMPYFALGYNGFGQLSNDLPFVVTGTNQQNHSFEYQIDKGLGFSGWKRLATIVVRASGGTTGGTTFNFTAKPSDFPQIGDYVQTASLRLPAGTTVTNVVGSTVTVSSPFLSNIGTNELVYFWKDIQDETSISPTDGVKLRVRATVNNANASNALTYLQLQGLSNATDRAIQYPLPVLLPTLTISGFEAGSDVVVFDASIVAPGDGSNVIQTFNEVAGTSVAYQYEYVPGTVVNIGVFKPGKVPLYVRGLTLSTADSELPVSQQTDRNYVS